jgi:PKD repeat protein
VRRFKASFLFAAIALLFFALTTKGQQGNNWYFGGGAGISFQNGAPVALLDGQMFTNEGCAAISDNNGQLLFYTDGIRVWNRAHQVMPNGFGLSGDPSSSNSAIVVPKPGSNVIYYVFTADAAENGNIKGYRYSEVDMSLNGGLGDVTAVKNVLLYTPSQEKLTAVRHSNGIDIWVITKSRLNNEWSAYRVDCNGVNPVPVVSAAGLPILQSGSVTSVGCLKASPDGTRLAHARIVENCWEVLQFDNATGVVSNAISQVLDFAFGVEFSPNSKYVYIGKERFSTDTGSVHQYDISVMDSSLIAASKVRVAATPGISLSGMQLGPDNKIYVSQMMHGSIGVINSPNSQGAATNFVASHVNLGGKMCFRNLPVFFPSLITNQNTTFNYTVSANCATVNFTGVSTVTGPLTWQWDFGDGNVATGQNVSHTYPTGGSASYTAKLTVTSGTVCGGIGVAVKPIDLNRRIPDARFGFVTTCGNLSVPFRDSSTITGTTIQSWQWDFGDNTTSTQQHPQHNYSTFGTYTVRLVVTSAGACNGSDTLTKVVVVGPKPSPAFNAPAIKCAGRAVQFMDQSTAQGAQPNRWYWNFGDNTGSTQQNPIKTFALPGQYTVKFAAGTGSDCMSDTIEQIVRVGNIPSTQFSVADTCAATLATFTGGGNVNNGTINAWWWSFGDNTFGNTQSPSHIYANAGTYTVRFVGISSDGCPSDTLTRPVLIGSKPVADFSSVTGCGNKTIAFTNQSNNTAQPITKWYWNFGDNTSSDQQHPSHTFTAFGDRIVKMVATSSLGCKSDTVEKVTAVNAKPKAAFGNASGCIGAPAQFTDSSTVEASTITSWAWTLENAVTSNLQNPDHIYTAHGDYQVRLVAGSERNCFDTITKSIRIEAIPVSAITAADGCANSNVTLQNNSTIGFGVISSHIWRFGNGDSSTSQLPTYRYAQHGNFTIQYQAMSANSCRGNVVNVPVVIESIPVVDFTFGNTCAGKEINFTNNTTNAFGDIASWNWQFGNGDGSSEFMPAYTYTKFGTYPVILSANTANGCSSSVTKSISISQVVISAGPDLITPTGQPIQLRGSGGVSYVWSPSTYLDNDLSATPTSIPLNNITYYLTGTTAEGCVGFDTLNLKVYKGPAIYVPNAFAPEGRNRIFKPVYVGIQELQFFTIYNRWGQVVFTTKDMSKGWDGRVNAALQGTGAFVWVIKAKDNANKIIEQTGNVLLIR